MDLKKINIKYLLFENNTIKQTFFKNTAWLGIAEMVSRVLRLILMIYVARILGATEYGKFTFALAFISIFFIFHDFGLPLIVTREFSGEKEREKEFYSVLSLKIVLSFIVSIIILISSVFVTSDHVIREIILILAMFSLISGFLTVIYAFFQARQKMEYQAWATILQASVVTPVGIFILIYFPSVINLSYSYLFSSIVALMFVLLFFHLKILPLSLSWDKTIWLRFIKMSWPMAFIGLFGVIYTYIDSVMMGYWGFITETGWYNAAYSIIHVILLPAGLISTSIYPILSKYFKESKDKLHYTLQSQMKIMILLAFPLVIGGIALAPKIIVYIYGLNFIPSILAFQILIIIAGFVFLSSPLQYLFIASNQQNKLFYINASGAALNIILNMVLIPKYSLYGAAVATLITYFVMFIIVITTAKYIFSIYFLGMQLAKYIACAVLATCIMYLLIKRPIIYNLNVLVVLFIGTAIYFATFYASKTIASKIGL